MSGRIRLRYVALWAYTIVMVLYILAPLAVVVLNSFSSVAYNVFPPEGYSLRWYVNLAAQREFYGALARSLSSRRCRPRCRWSSARWRPMR